MLTDLELSHARSADRPVPNGRRPGLPGAKLTTYRTTGLLREHENLEPSAGNETPGKPPAR
jgi:adenine deaminase